VRRFLLIVAYWMIYSTPIQLGFIAWSSWVVITTDETILSLSNDVFLRDYLPGIYSYFKPWLYSFLWNPLMDFVFSLPIVVHASLKAVVNTGLGFWLLRVART